MYIIMYYVICRSRNYAYCVLLLLLLLLLLSDFFSALFAALCALI